LCDPPRFQSAGRGQPGNAWESEEDKNLLLSIIVYPGTVAPPDQFIISMSVSLAISDFLTLHGIKSTIKWPNDIYVDDRKIAGILIENSVRGSSIENSIIGIGLNVNQQRFRGNAPNPVSMSMLTGTTFDTGTCLMELLTFLDLRYKNLIRGDSGAIREEYLRSLYRTGEWHDYITEGKSLQGHYLISQ
jgi:BirA family biotin operon repressor/biotin-[acetyl-CoA-carboxylase] ligase